MSSVKLKHASGNGTSLHSPAANPSADITLKVPSTTGSAGQVLKVASANHSSTNAELEWAADAGGKILQVQSTEEFGVHSSSSNSFVDVGTPTLTITPTVSTSKILFMATSSMSSSGANRGGRITVYMKDGSGSYADLRTDGDNGGFSGGHWDADIGGVSGISDWTIHTYVDHNSSNELNFKLYYRSNNADTSFWVGRTNGGANAKTCLTAIEVSTT